MLKSLLIGQDGSDDSRSALELGLRWAKRFNALAVGIAVVDEPGILTSKPVLLSGGRFWNTAEAATPLIAESRRRADAVLEHFARSCEEAGVAGKTLEHVGTPFVQILMEAQRYDLIVLGQHTHFDYGRDGEGDATLSTVLQDSPRPVVAVPKDLGTGERVAVAYDGSLQASRALYAFETSGLGLEREVSVVSVSRGREAASQLADRAVEFLRLHGIEATPHPLDTSAPTAEAILGVVHDLEVGLLVMGAYGQRALREFFLGSVTRTVLAKSPAPVFLYH